MKKILLIFIALLYGCNKSYFDKGSAEFYNMTEKDVVLLRDYISYNYYPRHDTALDYNIEHWCRFNKIGKNEKFTFLRWDDMDPLSKSDTISIFILDKQVFDTISWKKICTDYLMLCRYDLSGEDLKTLNSTIPYPPSPAMKDMKMYPPYEEVIKQEEGL